MWPDWRERAFSRFDSFGQFVGRLPSSPHTLWWGLWSWRDSTTVTGFSEGHRSASWARYLVSYELLILLLRLILLLPRSGSTHRSNPHWAALAGHSIESYVQTVRSSLPVYPRVCSILSRPILHAGQCNRRTLTTAICGGRCVVCAEVTHFDNWSAGFCHFLPFCLEQPPGWSSWSRPLSSFIPEKTEDLSV